MPRVGAQHLLRRCLGLGIDAERIDGGLLGVVAGAPIENQVCGQENQRDFSRQFGQQGRNPDVEVARLPRVGFARGALAERGAVNDQLRWLTAELAPHRRGIGQIQPVAGEGHHL